MGEIYRCASAVILYLGPAAAHDAEGIDLITLLYSHFKPSLQPILDMTWFFAYRRSEPLPVERLPDSVSLEHPGGQRFWSWHSVLGLNAPGSCKKTL